MKSLTGQYECAHRSGLGLDYFTARLDRLTLYANGRFALITQEKSRIMHAAKSLASGQQANMDAQEVHREGNYGSQGDQLFLSFDDGNQEQGQIQSAGIQIGQDYFEKVSDSTLMPPAQRMKSNMEDIAKGLKIAGTIGGTMFKAARAIQDTLQTSSTNQQGSGVDQNATPASPVQPSMQSTPVSQSQPGAAPYIPYMPPAPTTPAYTPSQNDETLFCDQCGSRVRPGKKFCNKCGARLP